MSKPLILFWRTNMVRIVVVVSLLVICGLPLLWLFLSAFKNRADMLASDPLFIFSPTIENFKQAFIIRGFYVFILNSALVAILSAVFATFLGVPAAYVFSRTKMKGRDHWLFFILSTRMVPPAALALPYFLVFREANLLNSFWGLVIAHTTLNLAFTVWTMKTFFDDIPKAVDDAAQIDGLQHFQLLRLLLPSVAPGLAVVFMLCLIFSWNEFFLSMVLAGRGNETLPVAVLGLVTPAGTQWGQVAAIATVSVIPILLLLIFGGRVLVRGITFGILKER